MSFGTFAAAINKEKNNFSKEFYSTLFDYT